MGWKKLIYKVLFFIADFALTWLVDWFDTNNDGHVDKEEFRSGAYRISEKASRLINKSL